jgi:hypothetical protein
MSTLTITEKLDLKHAKEPNSLLHTILPERTIMEVSFLFSARPSIKILKLRFKRYYLILKSKEDASMQGTELSEKEEIVIRRNETGKGMVANIFPWLEQSLLYSHYGRGALRHKQEL